MFAITFISSLFLSFLPVCLCLPLSVLNQSSPVMNVKKNVKKYCDTFSLYLITFHWSRGSIWALWVIIYLYVLLLYIYYYLFFTAYGAVSCQTQGTRWKHFIAMSVGAFLSNAPHFFSVLWVLFYFHGFERAFVSHCLNDVCGENNKCIRYCQTIWALS